MKHKTLFRLLLKAIGVWIFAESLPSAVGQIGVWVLHITQTGSVRFFMDDWAYILTFIQIGLKLGIGLYLFFGGKWIVDKAIPSNRPYCHECGYELTASACNHCPECGTPFQWEDVMPKDAPEEVASMASARPATDQNTADPATDHG